MAMAKRRVMARACRRPSLRRCNLCKPILGKYFLHIPFFNRNCHHFSRSKIIDDVYRDSHRNILHIFHGSLVQDISRLRCLHAPAGAGSHHPLRGANRLHHPICNISPFEITKVSIFIYQLENDDENIPPQSISHRDLKRWFCEYGITISMQSNTKSQ